jgi:hypothetical protein
MCFPNTHQLSGWGKYVNLCFFQKETKCFSKFESAKYPSPIDHEDPTSFKNSESMLHFFSCKANMDGFSFETKRGEKKNIIKEINSLCTKYPYVLALSNILQNLK